MLGTCDRCHGFVPATATACPCCEAPTPRGRFARFARMLLAGLGGGAMAVTLMACYGAPAHHRARPMQPPCPGGGADIDGDGACTPADCDDNNALVRPGAGDPDGDGADQNCDGVDGVAPPAAQATDPPAPPADPPAPSP